MNKEDILKILEGAKDKNGDVPMRLVRLAFKKLPEPCTDTISRQAALKICRKYWHPTFNPIMEEIEQLRPAQPEQRWIPCSERLPEVNEKPYYIDPIDGNELFESEQVLVFGKNENGYDYSVASHIYSTKSGDEWGNAYDSAEVELITILAWMPLPEPYRAERRIDNANVDA